ncbi:MAG: hypothetical protein PVS3B3_32150 [Ktedonobacteraceae bacterium]
MLVEVEREHSQKDYTLHIHKYILKYLRQDNGGSFVVKSSIGVVVALLFLALTLSIHVPGAFASAYTTPCAKSDQRYTVVQGDTLSWIAYHYHTSWSNLSSYGHIENPDLIFIGQVVCIPVQGFSTGTQVQQVRTVPHTTPPVTHNNPPQQVQQPVKATPVVVPPTSVPYTPPTAIPAPATGGSIPAIINQVFGAYGPAAVNVAQCESGLNPGAYNPSGASGLFQIMPGTWAGTSQAGGSPYNAYANALAAHEIFVRDGYSWREWTCQP